MNFLTDQGLEENVTKNKVHYRTSLKCNEKLKMLLVFWPCSNMNHRTTNQSINQSLFALIQSCFKKVAKLNEIINSKVGVLAARNNHRG